MWCLCAPRDTWEAWVAWARPCWEAHCGQMGATMDIGLKLASKFAWFTPVNAAYGINHNHSIVPTQCLVKAVRGGTCPLLADCPRSTSFAQSQSHWQNCTEGGRCTPVPDDIVHLAFLELGQQAQTFPYVSRSVPVLHKVPLFFFTSWENSTEFFHTPWGCFEMSKMASEH